MENLTLENPSSTSIEKSLRTKGFLHIKRTIPRETWLQWGEELGKITRIEDIRLGLSRRGAHSPENLDFHTDHGEVNFIGWRCLKSEPSGGPTLLLDGYELLERFGQEESLEPLKKIKMRCPCPDSGRMQSLPLLSFSDEKARLYYTPWNALPIDSPEIETIWNKFQDTVQNLSKVKAFGVRLAPGECLFIDNKRFFHGRGVLPPTSPRHLERVWIA